MLVFCLFGFGFSRQVALEPVLELALVAQANLELTEICLPLPPQWRPEGRDLLKRAAEGCEPPDMGARNETQVL